VSWYDLLVVPFFRHSHHVIVIGSVVFFFVLQWVVSVVSNRLECYRRLSKEDKLEWVIRVVSIVHALVSWGTVPGFFFPEPALATGDLYAYSEQSDVFFCISTGYFAWDLIITIYYGWGALFLMHAISSFGVFFFGLYPFLHYVGQFYLGVFELSTVWFHLRCLLERTGKTQTLFFKFVEVMFAVSFTIVRIIMGTYVSFWWWIDMVTLAMSGKAHSVFVICYYLGSNAILMVLQYYWFFLLLQAALNLKPFVNNKKAS